MYNTNLCKYCCGSQQSVTNSIAVVIGAEEIGGTFQWQGLVSGDVPDTVAKWGPGEPNSGAENCIAVEANSRWMDVPCTQYRGFACETDL